MKFVAQPSELKVAETYIKVIEIIKLNKHMRMLEELMDQWPFLINDVLLHYNPNDVWTEGGRNIHKVDQNHHSSKGHTELP